MKKLVSLKRRCAVFGALIALCSVALVFRPAETSTQRTEDLPALFEGFSSAGVTSIELTQGGSLLSGGKPRRVLLERREARDGTPVWVVASAFDYPAGDTQVTRLLSEISQARVVTETTRRAEAFDQYVEDGSWIEVKLKGEAGAGVAAFGVGKARDSETHLRLDAPARVVRVRNFNASSARATPEAWFQARMFPDLESRNLETLEVVQKIEVDGQPSTRKLSFVKRAQEAAVAGEPPPERGWDMTSPEAAPASRVDVDDLARALVGLIFQDVVAKPETGDGDAKFGLAVPEIVATATFTPLEPGKPGKRISLTLGALDAETKLWYARRGGAPYVFTVRDDDYATGRLRNDPSKYKETPKPAGDKPAGDAPGDAPPAPDAPKDGGIGDPDGGAGPGGEKPPEPAPEPPQPPEPAPAPAPESPKPPEPPKPPEQPGAPK